MGKSSQRAHLEANAKNAWHEGNLLTSKRFGDSVPDGRQLHEPKMGAHM